MKKILLGLLVTLVCITATACGTQEEGKKTGGDTNTSYTFESLEKDLKTLDKELQVNQKSAEMIGAKKGYGYILKDCTLEVYEFDKSSDAYKEAEKNQKFNLESMNMKVDATVKKGIGYTANGSCDDAIQYIEKLMK